MEMKESGLIAGILPNYRNYEICIFLENMKIY